MANLSCLHLLWTNKCSGKGWFLVKFVLAEKLAFLVFFSLDTLGTQQRHALLDAWNRQQENIVPAPAIEWEEKEDEPVFEFSVDMPDTTTAKNLDYYRGNKENVSFLK